MKKITEVEMHFGNRYSTSLTFTRIVNMHNMALFQDEPHIEIIKPRKIARALFKLSCYL